MACCSAATTGSRPTRAMRSARRASGICSRSRARTSCSSSLRSSSCAGASASLAHRPSASRSRRPCCTCSSSGRGRRSSVPASPVSSSPWRGLRTGRLRAGTCSPSRRPVSLARPVGGRRSRASSCRSSPSSRSSSRLRGSGAGSRAPRVLRGCASRLRSRRPAPSRPRRSRGSTSTASRSSGSLPGEPRGAAGGRASAVDRYRRHARASARARGRGAARARRERTRRVPGRRRARRRADRPLRQRGRVVLAIGVPVMLAAFWFNRPRYEFFVIAALAVLGFLQYLDRVTDGPPPVPSTLYVTFLDVGQGNATLITASGFAVLVDAGPADAHVARGLHEFGVHRLDALVLSHPQADHVGGAAEVLDTVPVGARARPGPSDGRALRAGGARGGAEAWSSRGRRAHGARAPSGQG